MSSDDVEDHEAIQPYDTTETDTAITNVLAKRQREHAQERRREDRAHVRELMKSVEEALVGATDHDPDDVLADLQAYLAADPELASVLSPANEELDDRAKLLFKQLSRRRERYRRGEDVEIPSLPQEYRVYLRVAKALGLIHAVTDMTRYAPITLEKLDKQGARSPVEGDPSPIGRRRISKSSSRELEEAAVEIPHVDCEHLLCIANPREGKDSLICRIAGNLKDEHGYKWVSLHDDGRFETSMIAIPNDEPEIRENLERFDQEPKGYPTKVYVPAISGLPDRLPANHVPFTIGVDGLTTEIVAQLSGVRPQGSTERRIKHALNEVDRGSGSVDELIELLETYADDTTAEITVTELREEDELEGDSVSSRTRTYQMGEDDLLRECAQSLMMLASEGLLRDRGAETNLDMVDVLEDQEHVAALNCNFLPDGDEHLKYLLENIWLRLIYRARDDHPWLPRVALEIREIKELAPSTLDRAKYTKIVKGLRQTLFFLSSQGGSRRIMMLGSTQYINDVYKPVRGNMPIKVLLKMGGEKISTLESAGFSFTEDERYQLRKFRTGWGMLLMPDGKTYPINWAGARCGLSLGDLEYLNRYGVASGYRVQLTSTSADAWIDEHDAREYYDQEGVRRAAPPERGEWFLLEDDVVDVADYGDGPPPDELGESVLEAALSARRDYPIPQDLRPTPIDVATEQRELSLVSTEEAQEKAEAEVFEEYDLRGVLRDWTRRREGTIEKYVRILEAIEAEEITKYDELKEWSGVSVGSIKQYANDSEQLEEAIDKPDGAGDTYSLTPVGKRALEIEWSAVFEDLDG